MTSPNLSLGERVMTLVDDLARHTDSPGLTRLYLSRAHRATAEAVMALMRDAGMSARMDAAGNVIGRYEGAEPGLPALLVGSHIDSVVDAGRYDGPLGVVCGIVLVEELVRIGRRLPFAIEVLALGDEENVRFPTNLSTAYAVCGRYQPHWLDVEDADGVRLRDALVAFGGDPDAIAGAAKRREDVIGYLEVHIEQGPLLEVEDLPIGIVTAINGITRLKVSVTGEAGHAGTVPMALRKDALAAAAQMIAAVERIGRARPDTVATVGVLQPRPGAVNVIPGRVDFALDARAPDDAARKAMVDEIVATWRGEADRRGVGLSFEETMDSPATPMHPDLAAALRTGIESLQLRPLDLSSGAGHDAVAMATLCPAAMMFVRCKGGVSHNPAESITTADADAAIRALIATVLNLSSRPQTRHS
jgi:allantoate deiminase